MVTQLAMVFGAVFVLVGVLGLVSTGGMSMAADPAPAMLLDLFPINLLHNVAHFAFGVWGLLAARSFAKAKLYCQAGGVIYVGLACLGFVAPTAYGLLPIGENNIILHAVVGAALAGFGFTVKAPAPAA